MPTGRRRGRSRGSRPGLQRAGARLPVDEYTRRLWERRYFVTAYSSASNAVGYEGNFLGQAWQVLTPLLNIGVYYLIFGLLLNTNRGVPNYIAFLAVGVFVFTFCTTALTTGARAITGNLGLVRALQFPRAVLPVSTTLVALMRLIYSMAVLIPDRVDQWGAADVAMAGTGAGDRAAGAVLPRPVLRRRPPRRPGPGHGRDPALRRPDVDVHLGRDVQRPGLHPRPRRLGRRRVMSLNPGYVYLTLARHALLPANPASNGTWLIATAWAVGTLVMSYLYFWRGEEEYGNV